MTSRRPIIGIPTALEQARYGVWDAPCALLQFSYVTAVQRAGAMVVMLPPDAELAADPSEALELIDGLILAGGCDVDPARYGQDRHPETDGLVPARDQFELALLERAIDLDMPTLCVCRGMQVLNILRGGTLIQHLPDVLHSDEHRRHAGTFEGNEHDVRLEPGSLAARAAGAELTMTRSHHHQGIDTLGDGLVATGRATSDGLVEAIELPSSSFVLGVQWHPEAGPQSAVIATFVQEVRQRISVASW